MEEKKIFAVDVDGVIFNSVHLVESEISRIDYQATCAYADTLLLEHSLREKVIFNTYNETDREICERLMKEESERYNELVKRYHIAKDEVLEEVFQEFKNRIDYRKIYRKENMFPGVINFLKFLIKSNKVKRIYFTTQFNVLREEIEKTFTLTLEAPEVEIIFIPFHDTPYIYAEDDETYLKNGDRKRTNKALWFKKLTGEDLTNTIFIDDSAGICEEARKEGSVAFWRDPASNDPLEVFKKAYDYLMGATDEELHQQELDRMPILKRKYRQLRRMYR